MGKNEKIIEDINRFCSPYSILVIDQYGIVRRIACPFKVITIIDNPLYKRNQVVIVEMVLISEDLLLAYLIRKKRLPYYLFAILL